MSSSYTIPAHDKHARRRRAISASLRSLAQDQKISTAYDTTDARWEYDRAILPKYDLAQSDNCDALRGASDALAMWRLYHDSALHHGFLSDDPNASRLFEALENVRCQALGAKSWHGMARNLQAYLAQEEAQAHAGGHEEEARNMCEQQALLRYFLANRGERARIKEEGLPLPKSLLEDLAADLQDQARFARLYYDWLRHSGKNSASSSDEMRSSEAEDTKQVNPAQGGSQEEEDKEHAGETKTADFSEAGHKPAQKFEDSDQDYKIDRDDSRHHPDAENTDPPDRGADPDASRENSAQEPKGGSQAFSETPPLPGQYFARHLGSHYHIFTSRYDEEIEPQEICTRQELQQLRQELDKAFQPYQQTTRHMRLHLLSALLSDHDQAWLSDCEEGVIDPARLTRIVTAPDMSGMSGQFFRQPYTQPETNTHVTILIDNSGSMRGKPILITALCVDILAQILEHCQISVEILGFTTKDWRGGQPRRDWVAQEKPANPGRLNALRHIIYKPANILWRQVKNHLGLVLYDDLLKENIDGEALLWAVRRIANRPEKRRILLVISDGAPVDDSTRNANPPDFLMRHLQDTIEAIENWGMVELMAIGIGHNVNYCYSNAVTIPRIEELSKVLCHQFLSMLRGRKTGRN